MPKLLWFDTESTGLNPVKNDIIQVSGIIVIDGKEMETFNFKCQPFSYENIDPEATAVHGITEEMMRTFPEPQIAYKELVSIFDKYVDRYDRNDKFIPSGFNVRYDVDFLYQFFKKNNDNYCFSWISGYPFDIYSLAVGLHYFGFVPKTKNFKLETLAEYFGVELNAHDSLSDVKATRELAKILRKEILRQT